MGDEDYDTAGLDPSDVGIVGPCGHDLPLSVAVRSASAGAAGASGVAAATTAALVAAAGAKHPSRHRAGAAAPRSCPKCGGQIASVEDGLARKGRPAVVFRYSNCLYALSVAAPPSSAASPSGPSAVTSWQSSASLNQQLLRGTAQGRIAEALGLASLKILCKGKVVYPSKDLTDEQASSQLLEISRRAMMVSSSSSASPGHRSFLHPGSKVPLLVMGTERGHELALKRRPPSPERPSPAGGGGGTLAGWARAAWDLAGTLGSAAFHLALSLAARSLGFVRSLLLPPQPPGTAAS